MSVIKVIMGVLICIALLMFAVGLSINAILNSSSGAFPLKINKYPKPRINEMAWPTIGFPSIKTPGSILTVELDLGGVGRDTRGSIRSSNCRAVLNPVRKALKWLEYVIPARSVKRGRSKHWPVDSRMGRIDDLFHIDFKLPSDILPELYDLKVMVTLGGQTLSDFEPHCVSVIEGGKDFFRFVTIADVHVHRRNISGWMQPQTNKGITASGKPAFFNNAIEQVNLIRPEFVIMLGDYVRAQHRPGDLIIEFENFYNALLSFEVPVFLVPGNHDLYVNEIDGSKLWRENLGPLYYSFSIMNCHFSCVNTSDWPFQDRNVMKKLGLFVYPRKWQGQILGAENEKDPRTYSGQLAWLRDDLENSKEKLKFLFCHHDPYRPEGRGVSFDNETFALFFRLGGGGRGRRALLELCSRYHVNFVFSGHLHSDYVGVRKWRKSKNSTVFANQTCLYFDEGGKRRKYPGYRIVEVRAGHARVLYYAKKPWSLPFYAGSVPGGTTSLDSLHLPSLSGYWRNSHVNHSLEFVVESRLGAKIEIKGIVCCFNRIVDNPKVRGASVEKVFTLPEAKRTVLYLKTRVAGPPLRECLGKYNYHSERIVISVGD